MKIKNLKLLAVMSLLLGTSNLWTGANTAMAQYDPNAAYIPPPPPGLAKAMNRVNVAQNTVNNAPAGHVDAIPMASTQHNVEKIIDHPATSITPATQAVTLTPPAGSSVPAQVISAEKAVPVAEKIENNLDLKSAGHEPIKSSRSLKREVGVLEAEIADELEGSAASKALVNEGGKIVINNTGQVQKLEHVLLESYVDNPTLRAARSELKAVHERLPQAQAGWKPTVTVDADVNKAKLSQSPGKLRYDGTTSKSVGIDVVQPLYRGGRTMAAVDGASYVIGAQRAILNATEQRIMQDVAIAYMDVVRDQAVLELRTNNKTVIEKQLEATRTRFEVGELTKTDVSQAEARQARAEADVTRARAVLKSSEANFTRLAGLVPGTLGYPRLNFNFPKDLDQATAFAESNNPAVIASKFTHKASITDIDGIFGELLPSISLFAAADKEYDPQPGSLDSSESAVFGVNASIPLYQGGATRSRVRQAKYNANKRLVNIQETIRSSQSETITNWEAWHASKAEIFSREAQVDAARIAREGVYQEADLGSRTILDTLDADQEYLDAQVALVGARRNEIVAQFALANTLGILTPQTLGFPDTQEDFDAHLEWTASKILGMDVDIVD
jgi:outer membrane protein